MICTTSKGIVRDQPNNDGDFFDYDSKNWRLHLPSATKMPNKHCSFSGENGKDRFVFRFELPDQWEGRVLWRMNLGQIEAFGCRMPIFDEKSQESLSGDPDQGYYEAE